MRRIFGVLDYPGDLKDTDRHAVAPTEVSATAPALSPKLPPHAKQREADPVGNLREENSITGVEIQ